MATSPADSHDPKAWVEQIATSLHAERAGIREFLTTQEQRLEQAEIALQQSLERLEEASTGSAGETGEGSDVDRSYQRRYEMALDDLRELKASNALLQDQLAKARSTASALARQSRPQEAPRNWESEKLRILAMLESELDHSDPKQHAERLKIEDVISATDQVVAAKDSEIRELQQRLDKLGSGGQASTDKAAAIAQIVNSDAVVQEERKRLQQLEREWQTKLSQAEVEISLERAKLARERVELEERLRSAENIVSTAAALANAADNAARPTRGRWMSRLGLTDEDRERGRRG
jgi:hypothetical protein